jgi:hypothetical protein
MRLMTCCAALLAFGLGSCGWYEEVKAAIDVERLSEELGGAPQDELARERLGRTRAERVTSGPRGPEALRLWVGVWCERPGSAATGSLDVTIDGVQLSSITANCDRPTEPPISRPNATAFALTVPAGGHSVTFTSPDGAPVTERFEIHDDRWLMIHHIVDSGGAAQTLFSYSDELIAADLGYDLENAPGAQPGSPSVVTGDAERDRRRARRLRENEARARRLAELNSQSALPVRRGENNTPYRIDEPSGPARVGAAVEASQPRRERSAGSRARGRDGNSGALARSGDDWNDASLGTVNIRSRTSLDVWVNGRSIQRTTPVEGYELPEGRHRVELRDGAANVVRTFAVEVEAGRTRTLVN